MTYDLANIKLYFTRPVGKAMNLFDEPMDYKARNGVFGSTDCYMLSEDFELAPGDWTLKILYDGKVVAARTFHVRQE